MGDFCKNELKYIYGNKLALRSGDSDCKIEFDIKKQNYEIAIYCNKKHRVAVIWNVKYRVQNCWKGTNLSYNKNWDDIVLSDSGLDCVYKFFKTPSGDIYEKILIVSFETLDKIKYDLYEYLKFDVEDDNIPKVLSDIENKEYDKWTNHNNRERISTSTWKRNHQFRKIVLENYNYKCAICNCAEQNILEAAHIIAVADGGADNIENGICLCRNHHRMFDKKLIKLDFPNHSIYAVQPSVKDYINTSLSFNYGNHEMISNN